jgi:hypothetical protein
MKESEWLEVCEANGWALADARVADAIRTGCDVAGDALLACSSEMFERWIAHIRQQRAEVQAMVAREAARREP